jgi:glycosyltransferase involved in cell wall biosynthesis
VNARPAVSLSVVIPAYNEGGSIGGVVRGLRRHVDPSDAEIIVVDDGSSDDTADAARGAGADIVLRLPGNRGKGEALKAGIGVARGRHLLFMDGDGQDRPEDVPLLVDAARRGARFVNGSRFIGVLEPGAISRINLWGNLFMSGVINLLFGTRISDSQAGFRVLESDLAKAMTLSARQYEIETEMLLKAVKGRVDIREVPVTRRARGAGRSHFRRFYNGFRILFWILRERVRFA